MSIAINSCVDLSATINGVAGESAVLHSKNHTIVIEIQENTYNKFI